MPEVDYVKLCRAIAVAETSGCQDGTAKKRNNCVGIMTWKNGYREPKYFPSHEASIQECAYIWEKSYKVFPTIKEAHKWTGNDNAKGWLAIVTKKYNSL